MHEDNAWRGISAVVEEDDGKMIFKLKPIAVVLFIVIITSYRCATIGCIL